MFNIHKFIHNHNAIYTLIKILKYLKLKIIIWIIQKIDLSKFLLLYVEMNESSFTQDEMAQKRNGDLW